MHCYWEFNVLTLTYSCIHSLGTREGEFSKLLDSFPTCCYVSACSLFRCVPIRMFTTYTSYWTSLSSLFSQFHPSLSRLLKIDLKVRSQDGREFDKRNWNIWEKEMDRNWTGDKNKCHQWKLTMSLADNGEAVVWLIIPCDQTTYVKPYWNIEQRNRRCARRKDGSSCKDEY